MQTHYPLQQKAPASSNSTITVLVLVCATLIGASAGILIAEREVSLGEKVTTAAQSIVHLTHPSLKSDSGATTPADPAPENPAKGKSAAKVSRNAPTSGASLLGAIRHSEQAGSASVDVELGRTVLVRADKAHNPERIFFDLRDSQHPASQMKKLKAKKSIRTDGTLVAGVRVSEWESGAVRVVLDLKRPCDYTYEVAPEPSSRLLVKLQALTLSDIPSNN